MPDANKKLRHRLRRTSKAMNLGQGGLALATDRRDPMTILLPQDVRGNLLSGRTDHGTGQATSENHAATGTVPGEKLGRADFGIVFRGDEFACRLLSRPQRYPCHL